MVDDYCYDPEKIKLFAKISVSQLMASQLMDATAYSVPFATCYQWATYVVKTPKKYRKNPNCCDPEVFNVIGAIPSNYAAITFP